MKNVYLLTIAALALALPLSVHAEEGRTAIIKGDKSYQHVQKQDDAAPAAQPQQANDAEAAANVEPAAGDEAAAPTETERKDALREQMQLPRKGF
jgi:hypothetical protein